MPENRLFVVLLAVSTVLAACFLRLFLTHCFHTLFVRPLRRFCAAFCFFFSAVIKLFFL